MTISPGTRVGRFEIISQLGAGGMGEVYRARDPNIDRDVAIKVLPHDVFTDPKRLQRFEQEVDGYRYLMAVPDHRGGPTTGNSCFISLRIRRSCQCR